MNPLKDRIALRALSDAPIHGWDMVALRRAAEGEKQKPQMAEAVFGSIHNATRYLADIFDRRMMETLSSVDVNGLRVRDRIATAVQTRLDLMAPYRDGLRVALAHYFRPLRGLRGARPLWSTADKIWVWAGDTATDYNHYTKRALLSGVMASTVLFWLQDNSPANAATRAFLDRRIQNVLSVGKLLGNLKKAA